MPEGPEVETVRRGLLPVINTKIIEVTLADEKKYFAGNEKKILNLKGMQISSIIRKGKFLIWEFNNGKTAHALNHLGMTGVWHLYSEKLWKKKKLKDFKHYKVYFKLDNNNHLLFINVRKFGKFRIMDLQSIMERKSIAKLGPDILELPFNLEKFKINISRRKKEIGRALLDYTVVSGCGNIYKSESLFRAGINPFRICSDLSDNEINILAEKVSEVAQEALSNKGSTLKDFTHVDGYQGLMQNKFFVYGKKDENCEKCDSKIISEKQGDRTTFYCNNCQN